MADTGAVPARLGAATRVLANTPVINPFVIDEFGDFVKSVVEELFEPLQPDTDTSVDGWLATTKYTAREKESLLKINDDIDWLRSVKVNRNGIEVPKYDIGLVKRHTKIEYYEEFKHARGIYARCDAAKIAFGPIAKKIEKVVFQLKWFVKNIPVRDRANYIVDNVVVPGATYVATDYSKYESCFRSLLMRKCERVLYAHMVKMLPEGNLWLSMFDFYVLGYNTISSKLWSCTVEGKRMSGEMMTSLGNGFSNLMKVLFTLHKSGIDWRTLRGVFEGDDGLYMAPPGWTPTSAWLTMLGCNVKMAVVSEWNKASFCGNLCDENDRVIITEPLYTMLKVPFHDAKYAYARDSTLDAILRAKALSIAHQYPGHPILQEYAFSILHLTRGVSIAKYFESNDSQWEKDQIADAMEFYGVKMNFSNAKIIRTPVLDSTRLFLQDTFGVPIEAQLHLEKMVWKLAEQRSGPVYDPILEVLVPQDWKLFADCYIGELTPTNLSVPNETFWQRYPAEHGGETNVNLQKIIGLNPALRLIV